MFRNALAKNIDRAYDHLSVAETEYLILQKQIERLERTAHMDAADRRALFVKRHQLRVLEAALKQ